MDDAVADEILDRHWQMVVNSIKVGAMDGDLDDVLAAENRRDPPRIPVTNAIRERMEKTTDSATDT